MAPTPIAYAFDAGIHCPECTRAALRAGAIRTESGAAYAWEGTPTDANAIPLAPNVDREGNPVHALYSWQRSECGTACDACGQRFD